MRTDNFRRMSALALAIPTREYERKDASGAPNPSEIKDQILGQVTTVANELKEIRRELEAVKAAGKDSPELKAELEKAVKRLDRIDAELQRPVSAKSEAADEKVLSDGFLASPGWKQWQDRGGWHRGGVNFKHDGSFFPESLNRSRKAALLTTGFPSAEGRIPGIIDPLVRDLRMRDLLTVLPTQEKVIQFVKETGFTNAASPQVEGQAKSESSITFEDDEVTVRTIAHWTQMSRQVLDDEPQLRDYIDNRMRYGLALEEESQILTGDGTGENLDGIIPQATAYDTGLTVSGDTEIDMILNAHTQLRLAEAPVEGTVLNPIDWGLILKQKTEEGGANKGGYIYGNPGQAPFAVTTLWGRPVVVTTAISEGTFLVGAFRMFARLFDRMQATVDLSSEHADFFVKNLVALRAEERVALAVLRPEGFVYGSF
jgi:HK97 family phage major capsid protein